MSDYLRLLKGFDYMNNLERANETLFEDIKHIDENGYEYWYARELMTALEYKQWRRFEESILRAKTSCSSSGVEVNSNFAEVGKITKIGQHNAEITVPDYKLSRYACYLIAMNGDPRKEAIALAQTYFAVKTRQQELAESFAELTEDQKRLGIRRELAQHNTSLLDAAHSAGISTAREYATFQNSGYKGLYGGMTEDDIHHKKKLKPSQKILDHMGSTELAANLFRATQTDEKLRRDNIHGVDNANRTHYEVGAKVRQTIKELGGTMPEDLPTPDKSIQQLKREEGKRLSNNGMDSLF